ncbi:hypothetical protein B0H13DRAFT_1888794 [Mycena leptocephala]|nr:hypothetical protein B0H13DRAFT_1888794 [Mycena leptocephala]
MACIGPGSSSLRSFFWRVQRRNARYASFLDISDKHTVKILSDFFERAKEFDNKAFKFACDTLGESQAKLAFSLMGFPSDTLLPSKVPAAVGDFASRCFAVVKLADLLAWVAQPDTPAPPVISAPSLVLRLASARKARIKFQAKPDMFSLSTPEGGPPAKRTVRLAEDAVRSRSSSASRKLNRQQHELEMTLKTIATTVTQRVAVSKDAEEQGFELTPDQVRDAVSKTNIATDLATPLLYAFNFHPSAVLNSFRILGLTPHQQLTAWKDKTNVHYGNPTHPLVRVTRVFMWLALRAALNLADTDSVPSDFFGHPEVIAALDLRSDEDQRRALAVPLQISDAALTIIYIDDDDDEGESIEVSTTRSLVPPPKKNQRNPKSLIAKIRISLPPGRSTKEPAQNTDVQAGEGRVTRSSAKAGESSKLLPSSSNVDGSALKRKAQSEPDGKTVAAKKPRKGLRRPPRSKTKSKLRRRLLDSSAEPEAENEVSWMALSDGFSLDEMRECEDLWQQFQHPINHLDPLLVYPKAAVEDEVIIDYYTFKHSDRNEDGTLRATKHATGYRWTPFKRNKQQAKDTGLIVNSRPTVIVDNVKIPLHVLPSAQRFLPWQADREWHSTFIGYCPERDPVHDICYTSGKIETATRIPTPRPLPIS